MKLIVTLFALILFYTTTTRCDLVTLSADDGVAKVDSYSQLMHGIKSMQYNKGVLFALVLNFQEKNDIAGKNIRTFVDLITEYQENDKMLLGIAVDTSTGKRDEVLWELGVDFRDKPVKKIHNQVVVFRSYLELNRVHNPHPILQQIVTGDKLLSKEAIREVFEYYNVKKDLPRLETVEELEAAVEKHGEITIAIAGNTQS